MSSINSDEIISILKEEIENFDSVSKDSEVGTVVAVGDGIATIYGIDHAMYQYALKFQMLVSLRFLLPFILTF